MDCIKCGQPMIEGKAFLERGTCFPFSAKGSDKTCLKFQADNLKDISLILNSKHEKLAFYCPLCDELLIRSLDYSLSFYEDRASPEKA